MSQENATKFLEEIAENDNLNEQLESALKTKDADNQTGESSEHFADQIKAFAAKKGYEFNNEDYITALTNRFEKTNQELSDEQLQQVAGGTDYSVIHNHEGIIMKLHQKGYSNEEILKKLQEEY